MAKLFKFKHYSGFQKKDFLFVYLIILFPVTQFLIFWLYVNLSSLTLSFTDKFGNITVSNFENVFEGFKDLDVYGFSLAAMLKRSLSLWGAINLIAFPISVATTYVLYRRVCGHYFFRVCFMLPGLIGAVIWTTIVKYMVAFDGPLIELFKNLGISLPTDVIRNGLFGPEKTAFPTVLSVTFFTTIVGGNVVLTGAFSRIPAEIYEVGKLEGIGFWKEFFIICVPCVWPTISMIFTFALCTVFTADANTYLYSSGTGEPGLSTMGFYLYYLQVRISTAAATGAYHYPAAIGMTLTIITLPVVLIGRWLMEKAMEPVEY